MIEFLKQRLEKNKETWYILSVSFGKEQDVKTKILNMQRDIGLLDIIAPEPIKDAESDIYKYFLGYTFLKLFLTVEKYSNILELESVFRFLGSLATINKRHVYIPYHVSDKDMRSVKEYLSGRKILEAKNAIKINDRVIIIKGDLTNIKGKVIEINKSQVKVLPEIFFQNVIVVPTTSVAHCK
jgi:transcription antitermination factor NusG